MNLQNKIRKFMYGRYGVDELYKFLFTLYITIFIIHIFIKSQILDIISLFIVLFTFYRVLSKNRNQRTKENEKYLQLKKKIFKLFEQTKSQDYIYKKCSKCKTTLKLPIPYQRGIKHTSCPKCKKRLTLLVLKKQKIEIIKKKK